MTTTDATPLALACWDLSWLLGRGRRHDPFASLERALDDTQRRGFNALRIDPCPHLITAPDNGVYIDRCELLPADGPPLEIKIRHQLKQLLQSAHERGLKLWLSSRFINDSRARRSFVRRPDDFITVWGETLSLIREWGYVDDIVGVDFCHQFPSLPAAHGITRRVFGRSPDRPLPRRWSANAERELDQYLSDIPRALRAQFPHIRFGLSTTPALSEQLRTLDTSALDFLDFSLWLNDDPRYRLANGDPLPMPSLVRRLATPFNHLLLEAGSLHWQRRLEEQLQRRMAFARLRGLQPLLGEGFIRAPKHLKQLPAGWADLHEMMVVEALTQGVTALTPSSLATPNFPWLWQDEAYLSHLNHLILSGS